MIKYNCVHTWQVSGLGLDADAALDDAVVEGALASHLVAVGATSVRRERVEVAPRSRLPRLGCFADEAQEVGHCKKIANSLWNAFIIQCFATQLSHSRASRLLE